MTNHGKTSAEPRQTALPRSDRLNNHGKNLGSYIVLPWLPRLLLRLLEVGLRQNLGRHGYSVAACVVGGGPEIAITLRRLCRDKTRRDNRQKGLDDGSSRTIRGI